MLFSVIIPCFNKKTSVGESIVSVLNQDFSDFELIVVNDGSTDGSQEEIEKYLSNKVHLINQQNAGVSVARNEGIKKASGKYVCFLDADDIWLPYHLSDLARLIAKFPNEVFYSTSFYETSDSNSEYCCSSKNFAEKDEEFISDNLFGLINKYHSAVVHSDAVALKKSYLVERKLFFEPGEKIGEDTDLWFRIALFNNIAITKRPSTVYRHFLSDATKDTTIPTDWIFLRRSKRLLDSCAISNDRKTECMFYLDRHKLTTCRQYLYHRKRSKAWKYLTSVSRKDYRFWLTAMMFFFPHFLFVRLYRVLFSVK